MPGAIHRLVNQIVDERSKGNKLIAHTTRAKIILKGVVVDSYDEHSDDDPEVLAKLKAIAQDLGIQM